MPNPAPAIDEWFEMECPTEGQDFDIRPMPFPGDLIDCAQCGKKHAASIEIGNACRKIGDGEIEYINREWSMRLGPPLRPDQIVTIKGHVS